MSLHGRTHQRNPENLEPMNLSALFLYPIKSCRGIAVPSATLDDFGFAGDRRWMLVDEAGVFISQREEPRLALVEPQPGEGWMALSGPMMDPTAIRPPGQSAKRTRVRVWDDTVEALDGGAEAARWFTTFLDRPCRLMYMPDDVFRRVDPKYVPEERRVHFGDAYPVLLIGEASLADLNGRLAQPIPMNRFRPNLVVAGSKPYEEDDWQDFRIGAVRFRAVKPCDRCMTTTVDQATGIKGKEPLTTLATYRKWEGQVFFGQNVVGEGRGEVSVGMEVEVSGKR